jgi:hypothetical protein
LTGGGSLFQAAVMSEIVKVAIVSDIHYASGAEQARGNDYEFRGLANPLLRLFVRLHRRFFWLRDPLNQNYLLERFIAEARTCHYAVANGDYSCNSAFVGLSDNAACQSAGECLERLRLTFGERLRANFGDHELGKISFFGGRGGMRLASWRCALNDLRLQPFWNLKIGNYVLIGIVSSLVALPVFESDCLPEERSEWEDLRQKHFEEIRAALAALRSEERVLLFCHDPTALPFLWNDEDIRAKVPRIEQTIIGHLHSKLIWRKSRLLSGMPRITFLGHTAKRLSTALREARRWRHFRVRLCPALAGIQLLNDGGFLNAELDPEGNQPARFQFHPVRRDK